MLSIYILAAWRRHRALRLDVQRSPALNRPGPGQPRFRYGIAVEGIEGVLRSAQYPVKKQIKTANRTHRNVMHPLETAASSCGTRGPCSSPGATAGRSRRSSPPWPRDPRNQLRAVRARAYYLQSNRSTRHMHTGILQVTVHIVLASSPI